VAEAVERFGSGRVVVSVDLRGEEVLVKSGFDGFRDAFSLINSFKAMGVSQVIVLDLLRVGSGAGVNIDFLQRVVRLGGLEVYVGGGVRDINDLLELRSLGVTGALVATALHNGKISIQTLKQNGLL
jgi:phosphoribosylformimino-5-aminoimidazole carboxamide ribotide isomerase